MVISERIDNILDLFNHSKSRNGYSLWEIDRYGLEMNILEKILNEKMKINKYFNKLRCDPNQRDSILNHGYLYPIFLKIKKKKDQDPSVSVYNEFVNELATYLKHWNDKEVKKYSIYFPLYVAFDLKTKIKNFIFKPKDLEFRSIDFLSRNKFISTYEHLIKDENSRIILQNKKILEETDLKNYAKIVVYARDKNYAVSQACADASFFLSLINYMEIKRTKVWTTSFDTRLSAYGLVAFLVFDGNEYVGYGRFTNYTFGIDEKSPKGKKFLLNDEKVDNVQKKLEIISKITNKKMTKNLISAFSDYQSGIISYDLSLSFHNLWLSLEKLLIKEVDTSYEILKNRLIHLLNLENNELWKVNIDILFNERHKLVHTGTHNLSQDDRNNLKYLVEKCIENYIWLCNIAGNLTDLVFLPCVVSISLFSSRASSRNRLIGAALGEMIATMRLETTEFPKPTLISLGLMDMSPFIPHSGPVLLVFLVPP